MGRLPTTIDNRRVFVRGYRGDYCTHHAHNHVYPLSYRAFFSLLSHSLGGNIFLNIIVSINLFRIYFYDHRQIKNNSFFKSTSNIFFSYIFQLIF